MPARLYLDHAATTPPRPEAIRAVADGLTRWANPSSPHGEGRAARRALEDARASVAAAVVFAREVDTRTKKDPRIVEAEKALATGGGAAKSRLAELMRLVKSEKVGQVADEYDRVHTIERALKMGSVDRIIAPQDLRPFIIDALDRGVARSLEKFQGGAK